MKNIHIIPTEKPSRLAYDFDKLVLNSRLLSPILYKTQNIYITSDEEIKEGDWCMSLCDDESYDEIYQCKYIDLVDEEDKKIILTTDQDLIKDGVQAIPDEFLEWFIKNPSCEEIEVESKITKDGVWTDLKGYVELPTIHSIIYKIIIPIEERKKNFYCGDEVDYDDKCLEQCDRCVDATGVDYGYLPKEEPKYPIGGYAPGNYMCNCSTCKTQFQGDKRAVQCEPCAIEMVQEQNIIDMMKGDEELGMYDEILPQQIWNKEKMEGIKQLIQDHKKETLEEATEKYVTYCAGHISEDEDLADADRRGFIYGAKWQKERGYSEEEVKNILFEWSVYKVNTAFSDGEIMDYEQWFEQFKKK